MKLFPEQKVIDYLDNYRIPDFLSLHILEVHSTSPEDLLKHCQSLLEFLEIDKAFQKYRLQALAFQALFEKFELYYKNQAINSGDKDYRFEFMEVEQALYLITESSATQDISSYLSILEEICDNDKLLGLIQLLYRKYDAWVDGYSEGYVKLMHFLAPYMSYLVNMKFDFHIIHKLDQSEVKETINKIFQDLKAQLAKRKIDIPLQEIELSDSSRSVAELMKLKRIFQEEISPRDNQFYFELGQWSFLVHLLTSFNETNNTFLNICLLIVPYFSLAVKLFDVPGNKGMIKGLESVKTIETDKVWKQDYVESTFLEFSKKECIDTFECVLSSIFTKKDIDPALFLSKEPEVLLMQLFSTVIAQRTELENLKSRQYGKFINQYEYLIWILLSILEALKSRIPENEKDLLIFIPAIQLIRKESRLRPFVKAKVYSLLTLLAMEDTEMSKLIVKNRNLLNILLKTIVDEEGMNDSMDLLLNLRYTMNFFNKVDYLFLKTHMNEDDFRGTILRYVTKINAELTVPEHIVNLKHIGIFLLEVVSLNIFYFLRDINITFLCSLIEFLVQKCQLDVWDACVIPNKLFTVIGNNPFFKPVILNKSMPGLFRVLETQTQRSRLRAETLDSKEQLIRNRDVKDYIFDLIMKDNNQISDIWESLEWDKRDSIEGKKKLLELNYQWVKVVYFTLEWLKMFAATLKPCKSGDDKNKLNTITHEILTIYFLPSFTLVNEQGDDSLVQSRIKRIFHLSKHLSYSSLNGFISTLKSRLTEVNDEIFSKLELKRGLLKDLKLIISREPFKSACDLQKIYLKCELKESLEVYMLIKSIQNLKQVYDKYFSYAHIKSLSSAFQKALNSLSTFFSHIMSLFDLENEQDLSYFSYTTLGFINKLANVYEIVTGPFFAIGEDGLVIFFHALIKSTFPGRGRHSSVLIIDLIMTLMNSLETAVKTEVTSMLLCQPNIWSLYLKKISDLLKSIDNNPNKKRELIDFLASVNFLISFKTKSDIESVKNKLKEYEFKISADQFINELSQLLAEGLENFPCQYVLCNNGTKINQTFVSILQLLERILIDHKESMTQEMLEKSLSNLDIFILLHSFDTLEIHLPEKINTARKEAFNNLSNFLNNYCLQVIEKANLSLPDELKEVKRKETLKTRDFLEIKISQYSPINELLTIQNYLQFMLKSLTQTHAKVDFEESLIWLLLHAASLLLHQILELNEEQTKNLKEEITKNQDATAGRINNLVDQLLRVFCSFFITRQLKQRMSKAEPQALYNWFNLIIKTQEYFCKNFGTNVLTFEGPSFTNLMALVQIIFYKEPDLALAQGCEMLHKLFSLKAEGGWKFSTVKVVVYALDILFEKHLPSEMVIENRLKRHLMASPDHLAPYSLSNIINDSVLKEYENNKYKTQERSKRQYERSIYKYSDFESRYSKHSKGWRFLFRF